MCSGLGGHQILFVSDYWKYESLTSAKMNEKMAEYKRLSKEQESMLKELVGKETAKPDPNQVVCNRLDRYDYVGKDKREGLDKITAKYRKEEQDSMRRPGASPRWSRKTATGAMSFALPNGKNFCSTKFAIRPTPDC